MNQIAKLDFYGKLALPKIESFTVAKTKYKYNPESLSYEEVELTIKDKILKISYYAIVGIVVSFIVTIFSFRGIQKSNDGELFRQNAQLQKDLAELKKDIEFTNKVLVHLQETDDNIYRSIY